MGLFFLSPTSHSQLVTVRNELNILHQDEHIFLNKAVLKNVAFCFLYLTQNENENASHNTAAPAKKKGMKKNVI